MLPHACVQGMESFVGARASKDERNVDNNIAGARSCDFGPQNCGPRLAASVLSRKLRETCILQG